MLICQAAYQTAIADRSDRTAHIGDPLGRVLVWCLSADERDLAALLVHTWVDEVRTWDPDLSMEQALQSVRFGIAKDVPRVPGAVVEGSDQDEIAALYERGRRL